jgi:hypothetical protein
MLANTMNVGISTDPNTDPDLGMDNMMLELLSTTRQHKQLELGGQGSGHDEAEPGAAGGEDQRRFRY